MHDDIEEIIEDGFTDEEKAEIREAEASPEQPIPVSGAEEPESAEPEAPVKEKPSWLKDLDKERKRRVATEKELSELKAKWQAVETRLNELAGPSKPGAEPSNIPDPNVDAFGHLATRIGATEEQIRQFIEMQARQREIAETQTRWGGELDAFKKEKPDIIDSMNYLAESRRSELRLFGLDAQQIEAALAEEGFHIVSKAHKEGKNPAEYFYEYAKLRGYSPKIDGIERISNGQRKVSRGASNGGDDIKGLTLDDFLAMSNDELEKLAEKNGGIDKLTSRLRV